MTVRTGLKVVQGKAINTQKDNPVSIRKIAPVLKAKDHTVRAWIMRGRLSADKKRIVKLRCVKMPGGLATTERAYAEFLELLNKPYEDANESTIIDTAKWDRPFYIDGPYALFRFAVDDLRWLTGMMENGDVLKIQMNQAIEELT